MEINFKGTCNAYRPILAAGIRGNTEHTTDGGTHRGREPLLISRNVNPQFGSLSGYFRWSFAGDRFTLWQRTDYNSTLCFNHRILDLPFGVLAAKDSGKDKETAN